MAGSGSDPDEELEPPSQPTRLRASISVKTSGLLERGVLVDANISATPEREEYAGRICLPGHLRNHICVGSALLPLVIIGSSKTAVRRIGGHCPEGLLFPYFVICFMVL
jgi:hypothetical protein